MVCVLLLIACDSSASYVSLKQRDGSTTDGPDASLEGGVAVRDGGDRDGAASLMFDATGATMDAAALDLDASIDLPDGSWVLPDGTIRLPDGTIIDVDTAIGRYTPEVDVTGCGVMSDDVWQQSVGLKDEGAVALVPGFTGFGLAYSALGTSGTCARNIDAAHLSATSGLPAPGSVLPECQVITDLSLLAEGKGWRLAWVDNFTGSAELHTVELDGTMQYADGQTRRTLTDNELLVEARPVLKRINKRPLLAWATHNITTDGYRITTQFLDKDAPAVDVVHEADKQLPQALALTQTGSSGAALAWVGPGDSSGVWLQMLGQDGASVDAPIRLSDKVAAASAVDLAGRVDGGGALYSIAIDGIPQLRFRRLDENGKPTEVERTVVGPPLRAQGGSLAAIGGGYAVAYRALPGGSVKEPQIRMTFITKEGNTMRDSAGNLFSFEIAPATAASGRTTIAVSVEGQIMVAWVDADPASKNNLLKVARRRLDCQ